MYHDNLVAVIYKCRRCGALRNPPAEPAFCPTCSEGIVVDALVLSDAHTDRSVSIKDDEFFAASLRAHSIAGRC